MMLTAFSNAAWIAIRRGDFLDDGLSSPPSWGRFLSAVYFLKIEQY
jgi:hypothetical protein